MQANLQEKKRDGGADKQSFAVSAPSIALPKGGGAIRGIGEKFSANPVTGTASISVPIVASPGRAGFGPQLSLSYDSGSGNGAFGFGWSLALPAITRKTDKGLPKYRDDSDVFILSGAEDLVPVLVEDDGEWVRQQTPDRVLDGETYRIERFRPRVEGLFARVERWTNTANGVSMWRSISRDNVTTWYGKSEASRIFDPADPRRVYSWLICETYDDKGNAAVYEYLAEDATGVDTSLVNERNRDDAARGTNRYLKRIKYGNRVSLTVEPDLTAASWMFEVVFDYGDGHYEPLLPDAEARERAQASYAGNGSWPVRADAFSSYRAGFEVRTYRLCRRVLMFHHFESELGTPDCLVTSTEFRYAQAPTGSFLEAVVHSGYRRGAGDVYLKRSLPPLEFEYSPAELHDEVRDIDPASLENLPVGLDGDRYRWVDLDGEGLSGVLTEQAGAWFYKNNLSTAAAPDAAPDGVVRFGPMQPVAPRPNPANLSRGQLFLDLAGDGRLDVVAFDRPTPGFFERGTRPGWQKFVAFRSVPNLVWNDPNLRFVDLTGDGHADILIIEDSVFTWYASLGEAGFDRARKVRQALDDDRGPRLLFADESQSVHLADLSGDGLTDLVRIRNGDVCYWPNLGYGRFGAKVTMSDSPRFDTDDLFDPKRILLADIDGSGTTDLLYIGARSIELWRNLSGNGFAAAQRLSAVPGSTDITTMTVVDLFGSGTPCLIWSSKLPADARRPMRYVDLMGGVKPHLMVASRNNLGAETLIEYASSLRFYLADKLAGKPWITRLPFPVQCVAKVTVTDKWRKTRFSTRYSYHHGYFDGPDREFRGFGRVEQVDVESYGEFAAGNADSPYITDDKTLHQPPVKTVTWFHTGVFLDRPRVLSQYEREYFPNWLEADDSANFDAGDFVENALPELDLNPTDLDAAEWREALRACKGTTLRREVYELDLDALEHGEHKPVKLVTAAYHNCHIRRLQPRAANRHAVFLVTESEAITYHYDLDLKSPNTVPDPRIKHTLNLNIDERGNVLQSAAVAYPRLGRHIDPSLPQGAEALIERVQTEIHIAYTEHRFTNGIDDQDGVRLPVPCESLVYSLTGIEPEDAEDAMTQDRRDNRYFTLDELRSYRLSDEHQTGGKPVEKIGYQAVPNGTAPQKRLVECVRTLFFSENLLDPLPFRLLGELGLPYESYKLALTDDLLDAILGGEKITTVQSDLSDATRSGYLSGVDLAARFSGVDTSGEYWIRSGIAGFATDAATRFYLPERYIDAFGQVTTLEYAPFDLFVQSSTDPVANRTAVTEFDYRVLAPRRMRSSNDNLSELRFDLLGLPTAAAVKGKGDQGDSFDGFDDDLVDPGIGTRVAYFTGDFDEAEARRLLGNATGRYLYYSGESRAGDGTIVYGTHPPCTAAIMRETHVAELDAGEKSRLQTAFEYFDGNGGVIVNKTQAEPENDGGPVRFIASGKTIANNKGKPVKLYEPYFTPSPAFEAPAEHGVTTLMYYDAIGRLLRTELPDGSVSRVVFSPWHVAKHDANDTVLASGWYADRAPPDPEQPLPLGPSGQPAVTPDQRAAWSAARHHGTPAVSIFDSLGREVVGIAHNRVESSTGTFVHGGKEYEDQKHVVFSKLDAEGKPLWVRDPRGNLVTQYITPLKPARAADEPDPSDPEAIPTASTPCYDMAGHLLYQHSPDIGDRWWIVDAVGQPFYSWDRNLRRTPDATEVEEDRVFRTRYDALRRPFEQHLRIDGGDWQVVERFVYGEGQPDDKSRNLRGTVAEHYNQSGRTTSEAFDFKRNPLEIKRQVASAYDAPLIDWPASVPQEALEPEVFTQRARYDALNRMMRLYNWSHTAARVAVYEPHYNERGLLEAEELALRADTTQADPGSGRSYTATNRIRPIDKIVYNAKGQYERISYGNGATSSYTYDPKTFRLARVATTRPAAPAQIQDLRYSYDAVGNVSSIRDDAQQTVYFMNAVVGPDCTFTYDPLYRLIEARGRESAGYAGAPARSGRSHDVGAFPQTDSTLRNYTQSYRYDAAGNLEQMRHQAGSAGSWTRDYEYAADGNRLLRSWTGGDITTAVPYRYDTHGNMLNLDRQPDEFGLRLDYRDMLHHVDLGGGGRAWYTYHGGKERIRKRIERLGGVVEERLYLGGMERYRRFSAGNLVEEIETFHVSADKQRVMVAEDVLATDRAELGTGTLYRFRLGNHAGSASIELDDQASIVSYEEYHPYGSTAYRAGRSVTEVSLSRYRYTGMERDEETGLGYHGTRYYAFWLGRWTTSDPAGLVDGPNLYTYARGDPVGLHDPDGMQPEKLTEADRVIMQMTCPELHKFMSGLSPDLQRAFAASASGRFADRASKMIANYNLQAVKITSKTRTIGDVAPYSKQGKANYVAIFGSKRRADEAEHALATAAANHLLEEEGKWKRESPTIVLAEAHSRMKTPTDNKLTKDLKAGKISAEEWLRASRTNAYRSWFEARARGVPVPSAEEMANAIIQQETQLKIRYYALLEEKMNQIQRNAAYGEANNVTRFQGMVQTRLDQTAEAQAHGQVRTQVFVGLLMVEVQAIASLSIISGQLLAVGGAFSNPVPAGVPLVAAELGAAGTTELGAGTAAVEATAGTGLRIATTTGVRIAVSETAAAETAALEAAALEEALAAEQAALKLRVLIP